LSDKQKDDMDAIKSDLGEVKGRLERITSENRRTSLFFAALGAGLSLLLAVGGDSVVTLEGGDMTMYVPSSLVTYGTIFTIIGLVVVFSSLALAWLWPRLKKQD
jgi:hypothetical protein